jgi:hypothetical protein
MAKRTRYKGPHCSVFSSLPPFPHDCCLPRNLRRMSYFTAGAMYHVAHYTHFYEPITRMCNMMLPYVAATVCDRENTCPYTHAEQPHVSPSYPSPPAEVSQNLPFNPNDLKSPRWDDARKEWSWLCVHVYLFHPNNFWMSWVIFM